MTVNKFSFSSSDLMILCSFVAMENRIVLVLNKYVRPYIDPGLVLIWTIGPSRAYREHMQANSCMISPCMIGSSIRLLPLLVFGPDLIDAAPPIVDATPWPRSPPSGPTTQTPAIYVKVNSFLSMVDLNTNLNGMLPHAYHHDVYRCRRRQGPREKELPWCKEERRRRKEEKKEEE